MNIVTNIMGDCSAFMNTQLFFDPANNAQKNYWHRDPQYHMSIEEQQAALRGPAVVHFRVPLFDELGIELIPKTHTRWDSADELDVRLELNGRKRYEELPSAVRVSLKAGDLLIFNANMIHRGVYGMDRLALDILFCDPSLELAQYINDDCLPDSDILAGLENASAFARAAAIKVSA
jgi:ectoine hydroxylase-related dioxygenase (phytanoyl-CoA dioxygenase family)